MPQRKNQINLTCEQCGISFALKASLAKNRRFCSWACRIANGNATKEIVKCLNCGKEFEAYKNQNRQYCSLSCGISARNKTDANPSYHRDLSGENNPMYGKGHLIAGENNPMYGRTGPDSPAWRGGRKIREDGYIMARNPDHPLASDGYVLEHRLVMEQHLGRFLLPEEVVHHIDGNPSNNDINNLQLFASQSDHISIGHG